MLLECILLSASLCHAVKDKPVMALTVASASTMMADGYVTDQKVDSGGVEEDPLSRALVGRKPTWKSMVGPGIAANFLGTYLGERMRTSHHRWERRLWWLPQTLSVTSSTVGLVWTLKH